MHPQRLVSSSQIKQRFAAGSLRQYRVRGYGAYTGLAEGKCRHFASQSVPHSYHPEVTKLSNGVRVASENTPGHITSLGIYVDAGSRYESKEMTGISHLLDRLAFKSTQRNTAEQVLDKMQAIGGTVSCNSSRESIMYQASVFPNDVQTAFGILAETVHSPLITEEEVEEQRQTTLYEISEIWSKPEMILPEILHSTAYQGNTLGNPMLCPASRLEEITPELIHQYRSIWYSPERIVVAGTGVEHERLVNMTQNAFEDLAESSPLITYPGGGPSKLTAYPSLNQQTFSRAASSLSLPAETAMELATRPAYYTGGSAFFDGDSMQFSESGDFTHLYIAFEGLPIYDPDIYALATLQILLGGGGSFSAGGPGKGMYSRLYTRVLNQHYWVENCMSFNHCYTDSGLFGLSIMCKPEYNNSAVEVAISELASTLTSESSQGCVTEEELSRAKNQLSSALLMSLEIRQVQCEDLGRQVQIHGSQLSIHEMIDKINRVNLPRLRDVAQRVLTGNIRNKGCGTGAMTVVAQGNLRNLQDPQTVYKKYLS